MENQKQPLHTTQPATPRDPEYDTPKPLPTPAHPTPLHLPKWLALLLLLFIAVGIFFGVIKSFQIPKPSKLTVQTPVSSTSPTSGLTTDWKTHASGQLGITFKYPSNWILKDIDGLASESASIELYPPTVSDYLESVTEKDRSEFVISIKKLPERASDQFQLFGMIDDPKFHHKDYVYSKKSNKSEESYQMTYREEGLTIPHITKEFGNTTAERDAYFIKDNGEIIHIKPGAFVGVNKKFYDIFLDTFKLNENTLVTSCSADNYPASWVRKHFSNSWNLLYPKDWKVDEIGLIEGHLSMKGCFKNDIYYLNFGYPLGGFASLDEFVNTQISDAPETQRSSMKLTDITVAGTQAKKVLNLPSYSFGDKMPAINKIRHSVFIWKSENVNQREVVIQQVGGESNPQQMAELLDLFLKNMQNP
ncbi:MAG TPA: hypothetical protein VM077_05370 [Candidatus Limnocylindrales bacterium]|nr:hypothetical protein [Candidatus Limnocylindrales bacterium]